MYSQSYLDIQLLTGLEINKQNLIFTLMQSISADVMVSCEEIFFGNVCNEVAASGEKIDVLK
jgi:hypothetical protein